MKNLKKLSAAFMLAALLSTSLTSCIDNEVSPVVEAIYANQAELLAAQTAVQNAEASLLEAQANTEASRAALLEAQANEAQANADATTAETTADEARWTEELATLIEMNDIAVEAAQQELDNAQAAFDAEMAELANDLAEAGAELAATYAEQYAAVKSYIATVRSSKNTKIGTKANKLAMITLGEYAPTMYLSSLQADLVQLNADALAAQATITELEAYLADPTTDEARIIELKAEKAELVVDNHDLGVQIAEANIALDVLEDEYWGLFWELHDDYDDAIGARNTAQYWVNNHTSDVEGYDADILAEQTILDNYDTTETTLTATAATAATAVTDAVAAEALAHTATVAADAAAALALTAEGVAETALSTHNTALSNLNGTYQTAIANYATEQGLFDAGLPAATLAVTNAQAAVDAAVAAEVLSQTDYDAKKAAFETAPAGYVWTSGPNVALGIHADATTVTASYRNYDDTASTMSAVTLTNNASTDETGNYGTYAAYLADAPTLGYDSYFDVGTDDIAGGTNADRLDAALIILTADEAAIAPLQATTDAAQLALDNFGDDLDAAIVTYNEQKALYDAGLATQATLVAAEATAHAATVAADLAAANALTAEGLAETAVTTANAAKTTADNALSTFLATTKADYAASIEHNQARLAEEQVRLEGWSVALIEEQAKVDAILAAINEINDGDVTELREAIGTARAEIAAWEAEQTANNTRSANINTIVAAIGTGNLTIIKDAIDAAQTVLTDNPGLVEAKALAITNATFDIAAIQLEIDALTEEITALEAIITNSEAVAASVYALLLAALGN